MGCWGLRRRGGGRRGFVGILRRSRSGRLGGGWGIIGGSLERMSAVVIVAGMTSLVANFQACGAVFVLL